MAPPRRTLVCDVHALRHPDLATVDVLARLQLAASRLGWQVLLRSASPELVRLLALAGLEEALPLELERQPEEREELLGVEEERQLGDPPT